MRTRSLARPGRTAAGIGSLAVLAILMLAGSSALGQGAAKPAGVQVWGGDILDSDFGAPGGAAPAIAIYCPRNGSASGKVLVGADGAIEGLKAVISDLKQTAPAGGAGVIAAAQASVRYAVQWDGGVSIRGADILLESPPAVFPAAGARRNVVPVWVTVAVPKDAKPGSYAGLLTIEAKGAKLAPVPVKVEVTDWTLPDTQDFRAWTEILEQPETLAAEYNVPLWSDKHWEMIAKSLRLIAATGSRVVYVPIICRTNYGTDEAMVRWIKKADGTFDYDYSIMEKYLDCVQKNMGTPKLVLFNVWEVYLYTGKRVASQPVQVKGSEGSYDWRESSFAKALRERQGKGAVVTLLDGATKKAEQMTVPRYDDPASKAMWKPLWDGVASRMKARGLEKAMMLAQISDLWPQAAEIKFWGDLTGGLPWASCSHHANRWLSDTKIPTGQLPGGGTIGLTDAALDFQFVLSPAKDRHYGWKKPMLHALYWRFGYFNNNPLVTIRNEEECNITGNQRGVGHIGGDFWPCFKTKSGKRTGTVTDRYPESYWHSLNIGGWLLAPGPTGPVGTARLEVFREGVQECEARIAIEDALTNPASKAKLGDELAKRAQDTLDERQLALWRARGATDDDFQKYGLVSYYRDYVFTLADKWKPTAVAGLKAFIAGGWAQRSGKLFDLAGEVQRKVGK